MSPINSQISNLRLRIEILQDRREIESSTCYELSLRSQIGGSDVHRLMYERESIEKVDQIGKRIETLEDELAQLLAQWPGHGC